MKIGVIIPSRGDRPALLRNCLRMMKRQTLQPAQIGVLDYKPKNAAKDITERYRIGYEYMSTLGLDLIAFIEDDDWYSPEYLKVMASLWIENGRPELFGLNHSTYYHIIEKKYFEMQHFQRSAMMCTFIKPGLQIEWCKDDQPYTDAHLWTVSKLQKKLTGIKPLICMGIKHGIGRIGGQHHNDRMDRYINSDSDLSFLKSVVDSNSFEFYSKYFGF